MKYKKNLFFLILLSCISLCMQSMQEEFPQELQKLPSLLRQLANSLNSPSPTLPPVPANPVVSVPSTRPDTTMSRVTIPGQILISYIVDDSNKESAPSLSLYLDQVLKPALETRLGKKISFVPNNSQQADAEIIFYGDLSSSRVEQRLILSTYPPHDKRIYIRPGGKFIEGQKEGLANKIYVVTIGRGSEIINDDFTQQSTSAAVDALVNIVQ